MSLLTWCAEKGAKSLLWDPGQNWASWVTHRKHQTNETEGPIEGFKVTKCKEWSTNWLVETKDTWQLNKSCPPPKRGGISGTMGEIWIRNICRLVNSTVSVFYFLVLITVLRLHRMGCLGKLCIGQTRTLRSILRTFHESEIIPKWKVKKKYY